MTNERLQELLFKEERFIKEIYDDFHRAHKAMGKPKPRINAITGDVLPPRRSKMRELVEGTLRKMDEHLRKA